jgi:hypothetical protein
MEAPGITREQKLIPILTDAKDNLGGKTPPKDDIRRKHEKHKILLYLRRFIGRNPILMLRWWKHLG